MSPDFKAACSARALSAPCFKVTYLRSKHRSTLEVVTEPKSRRLFQTPPSPGRVELFKTAFHRKRWSWADGQTEPLRDAGVGKTEPRFLERSMKTVGAFTTPKSL